MVEEEDSVYCPSEVDPVASSTYTYGYHQSTLTSNNEKR